MTNRLGVMAFVTLAAMGAPGCGSEAPPRDATHAPAAEPRAKSFGLLVMAHGGPPEWNEGVLKTVEPLRSRYEVEVAFGMADADSLQHGVRNLEARGIGRIGVLRLFISGESWYERTEQILGLQPGAPARRPDHEHDHGAHAGHGAHGHGMEFYRLETNASFALSREGLADATTMGLVLADRAAALSKDPSREDVLVLAHGPEDDGENERWLKKLGERAETIRSRGSFRRVQAETLREDWPEKRELAEKRIRAFVERAKAEGGTAIVIPFRVQGFGPYAKVLEGLEYRSDGQGLIPHAEVTRWLEAQAASLASGPFRAPLH